MKRIETSEIIDNVLWEWYSERGLEVPQWKRYDPQWWTDYLNDLNDSRPD